MSSNGALSLRTLVLTPSGRDAPLSAMLLREAGFAADICRDLGVLIEELHKGAGLAIIADEALQSAEMRPLIARTSLNKRFCHRPSLFFDFL